MKYSLLFFLCLNLSFAYCQQGFISDNKQAQKSYESAGKYLGLNMFDKALAELENAVKQDGKFAAAYLQAGDIYRIKLQNYEKAKPAYRKALDINPNFDKRIYWGLGQSEFYTGNYSSALSLLKKYSEWPNLAEESKKQAAKYLADCEFSIQAVKMPVPYNPINLGSAINTTNNEYLPVVTADEEILVFTRNINKTNEDFYTSRKNGEQWQPSVYLSPNINTSTYNEGAQCISPDGMYLFFTGCNRPDGAGRCDIYVCKREGKDWSKPFNLGAPINTPGWESQPSISADGRTLYFVSSRAGGLGGFDIWKTELQPGGVWAKPVNLGPTINTPYDEISPFLHPDNNTLYFASNGWPGLGNQDIFLSKKDDSGNWTKPFNLGYPINTAGEQSCLTVSNNGKTAFFAADIKGGRGGFDIYSFELPQSLRPGLVTYVKGKVFDSKNKEPLDANIKITALKTDIVGFDDVSDYETGEFLATMPVGKSYALSVDKKGYLFHSENFSLDKPNIAAEPFILSVPLERIELGGMVILNNIFFDTNKFDLLPESKTELQQLISFLAANPGVSIEIGGHTDNVGDDNLNHTLSENRAKTVYNYLLVNKIAAGRLSYHGFGESKPVSSNNTEQGRQLNRRTEFKVTKL